MQNFGGEFFWKTTTWKAVKEMEHGINIDFRDVDRKENNMKRGSSM
jgi:hypothetical protein